MTVSESTLRTLAGLAQGRNVAPAFAAGYGPPTTNDGIDLQNYLLSVVQIVREPELVALGRSANYAVIEGALDAIGNPYTIDCDGTPATHVVTASDNAQTVMEALAAAVSAVAGFSAVQLVWPHNTDSTYRHGLRIMRDTATAAPTATAGLNLVVRGQVAAGVASYHRIWLRQTLANSETVWSVPGGGTFDTTYPNWTQRLQTAGYDRLYIENTVEPSVSGVYVEAYAAPCTPELT